MWTAEVSSDNVQLGLLYHLYVVWVAFTQSCFGYPDEDCVLLEFFYVACAEVA
jgi:hypothetical protein